MNLYIKDTAGDYRTATPKEILWAARSQVSRAFPRGCTFSNAQEGRDYFHAKLVGLENEVFAVAFLDNRHRLIAYEELFSGTIDGCSVHPRVVVQRALHHNAGAVIFGHNHPSGEAEPSRADEQITERLKNALNYLDVRVLDHRVVGDDTITSMAERGMI
ncbi:MAG: DNA repair protein [Gammaproteobacteria bacterium]|nr:DNA repair protein [Gammaproteobacteria bacterium]